MKLKNLFAGFLTITVISLSAATTFAANTENIEPIKAVEQINLESGVSIKPYFKSFTGTVKKVSDSSGETTSKFLSVVSEDGQEANIIVSSNTYIVNNAEIAEGSVITGFYDANAPMIMIYPPQYNAQVIVVGNEDQNIKFDVFNADLISSDNFLKLNIGENTEIILQDGTRYEGELANRKLVVMYGISTKSIPAQTTPSKVVVLFEKAVPIEVVPEENTADISGDVSAMDIIVNNNKIEAPAAYINEQGTVMLPLRAISEALGFDVTWNSKLKSITLGKGISLTIGKDYYIYMKTSPIQLGTAPTIVNERTFVPIGFFQEVVRVENVNVTNSQIIIGN